MQQKTLRSVAVGGVFLLTLIGCLMRVYQLYTVFDASGLPETGNPSTWMLTFLSALMVLLCILLSAGLKPVKNEERLFYPNPLALILGLAAGICFAAGAVLGLYSELARGFGYGLVLKAFQLLAALCVLVAAWQRWKTGGSILWLHALICLWQVLTLLLNFKNWSMDPTILDYCFRLFALICGMCAAYHVGEFSLQKGRRKTAAFWCLAGCYFSVVSAIGEDLQWKLMAIGLCLWQLSNAWSLLSESKLVKTHG